MPSWWLLRWSGHTPFGFEFFTDPLFTEVGYDRQLVISLLIVVPFKLLLFWLFGLYRGMWRYTNLRDMKKLALAILVASMVMVSFIAYRYHFSSFARSVYVLDAILTFALVGGLRITVRVGFSYKQFGSFRNTLEQRPGRQQRTLVIGAGYSGERPVSRASE